MAIHNDLKLDKFLRDIGQHPWQNSEELASRKDRHLVNCVACSPGDEYGRMSDSGMEEIQCSTCFLWSHGRCVRYQFGLDDAVLLDGTAEWICPGRCDPSFALWNDNL